MKNELENEDRTLVPYLPLVGMFLCDKCRVTMLSGPLERITDSTTSSAELLRHGCLADVSMPSTFGCNELLVRSARNSLVNDCGYCGSGPCGF